MPRVVRSTGRMVNVRLHADSVALVYESVHMARIYANNDTWAVGVRA